MNVIALLFCASAVLCGRKRNAGPQPQPDTYKTNLPVSRENFEAFEKGNLHLNSYIPGPPAKGLRIMTFNLHFFRDLYDKRSNLQEVLADIKTIGADICLFQEVTLPGSGDRTAFDSGLEALGYKWRHFGSGPGAWLGNMIASKYPLSNLGSLDLDYTRVMVEGQVALLGGEKLTLFATHWQNADAEARNQQSKKTVDYFQKQKGGPAMGKFVLGADFNALYRSPAIQGLLRSGLMENSFNALRRPYPNYTCWGGTAIDFLFAGNGLAKTLVGTYMFHTLSSDHLPIIIDLDCHADPTAVASTISSSSSSIGWIIAVVLVIVAIAAAAGFLFYKRRANRA